MRSWAEKYAMEAFTRVFPTSLSDQDRFTQDLARKWRRHESQQILASLPKNPSNSSSSSPISTQFIALAHHRDDQLETILMKLIRGCHITHLQGMKANDGVFIRPLLDLSKSSLVQYLESKQLEWREDKSNQERDYKRNRVRLDLMPLMEDLAGNKETLERRLLGLSDQSSLVKHMLDTQVNKSASTVALTAG